MAKNPLVNLSRREQQIMDVLIERGSASVAEVRERIPDPPTYSAVRALLRVLEEKGHVRHRYDGPRYVYHPTADRNKVRRSALKRLVTTFFGGSTQNAVAALLDMEVSRLAPEELDRLARLIEQARTKAD